MAFEKRNENISVKLEYYGELRRFSVPFGFSFKGLVDEIVRVIGIEKEKERDVTVKYRDEEGDLITMSSDLELKAAIAAGALLRLYVSLKRQPDAMVIDDGAAVQQQKAFPPASPTVQERDASMEVQLPAGVGLYPHVPPYPCAVQGAPIGPGPDGLSPFLQGGRGGFGPRGGFNPRGGWGGHRGSHHDHHGHGHHGHGHHYGRPYGRGGFGYQPWRTERTAEDGPEPNYETLADQVMAMGWDIRREKVLKMLRKFDANIQLVTDRLAWKMERKQRKVEKKAWKAEMKAQKAN